jgi:hypothetical protein
MNAANSLVRCFKHPLVVSSIVLLLVNDHILKVITPSALTGKLSDFAGLFFFPFLVGAVLQLTVRFMRPARPIGSRPALLSAFAFSAVPFGALKIMPGVNLWVSSQLTGLFHLPVQIALDPSDLVALGMFLPAWWLWNKVEKHESGAAPGKRAWLLLGAGALACVATAPCPPIVSIQRVVSSNERLYAGVGPGYVYGYASDDLGQHWQSVPQLPKEILADLTRHAAITQTVCDPADEKVCFRVDGQPWVEESRDGGSTWQVAWQIPPGREAYMQRVASQSGLSCGKLPDLRTFDIGFLADNGLSVLVVAMGNEGVLLHSQAAGWQRVGVDPAHVNQPTPFYAANLSAALGSTSAEWAVALAAAYLLFLILGVWGWGYARRRRTTAQGPKFGGALKPLWILAVWVAAIGIGYEGSISLPVRLQNVINIGLALAGLALPFGILVIWLVIWGRVAKLAARPASFVRYGWFALGLAIIIWAVVTILFVFWAMGVIAGYQTAWILAVLGALIALGGGFWMMKRGLRRAVYGQD